MLFFLVDPISSWAEVPFREPKKLNPAEPGLPSLVDGLLIAFGHGIDLDRSDLTGSRK